jgi:hypothetical protein
MPIAEVTQAVQEHTTHSESATRCVACPHPWRFHDQIAARFCTASAAAQLDRGCVCGADAVLDDEAPAEDAEESIKD